jgi:hypothetical protein
MDISVSVKAVTFGNVFVFIGVFVIVVVDEFVSIPEIALLDLYLKCNKHI